MVDLNIQRLQDTFDALTLGRMQIKSHYIRIHAEWVCQEHHSVQIQTLNLWW